MRTFKDKNGNEWRIEMDLACVSRIKYDVGVNVLDADNFSKFLENYLVFADMIWAAVSLDAFGRGITKDQFFDGLGGDILAEAIEAFNQALFDFFPQKESREMMRAVYQKFSENTQIAYKKATEEVRNIKITSQNKPNEGNAAEKSTSSKSVIASAESSESTPATKP